VNDTTIIWRTLIAVIALVALSATSASAHEFVASKAGTVKGKQVTVQKFETSSGIFECKKDTAEGSVVSGSQGTVIVKVQFLECAYFGFGMEASVAEFELSAEGTATLKKLVTMEVPLAGCEITFPTAGNSNMKTVTYKNLAGGKLEIKSLFKGMTYGATGGGCGEPGKNGAFNGASEVELPSGTLEWK
jgi:hypothetical protein